MDACQQAIPPLSLSIAEELLIIQLFEKSNTFLNFEKKQNFENIFLKIFEFFKNYFFFLELTDSGREFILVPYLPFISDAVNSH